MDVTRYCRVVGGPLKTNTYIVYEGDVGFVVDPGAYLGDVIARLKRLRIKDLRFIIATHGHFDHVFYAGRLCSLFNARFYIHGLDVGIASDYRAVAERLYGDVYEMPEDVGYLHDGMTLRLAEDFEIRFIHAPGHTRGSTCILTEGLLITGDTLFKGTVGRTDFPESSQDEMASSLRRLASLPDDLTVLPGHGDTTTLGREKRTNPFMRDLLKNDA
ncbi:MAG: MBL fold metallo-hydrolase [Zestosphaera sp.]